MTKIYSIVLTVFIFSVYKAQQVADHVPGQLLVQAAPGSSIDKIVSENYFFHQQPSGITLKKTLVKSMNIFLLEFDTAIDENEMLAQVRGASGVQVAQFNHYVQPRINVPNDTYFSSMWGLDNTGQSGGVADADIDAPEAWDITTGGLTALGDTIVVAVIDGGFQLTHTDLSFWKNYNEIPGNSIDDDGNGYVDDINGWNANNNNPNIGNNAHGTHVAGTIGAKGNNGIGTTGVSWNVKIMAIDGSTSQESEAVIAYGYVVDNRRLYNQTNGAKGAFVVATNSSFGVDNGQPSAYPLWCAMYDSLGAVGVLSAGATANQNWDIDAVGDIPTGCSSAWLVSVTNMTRNDVKYTNAGYGLTTIDIGAPGTSIYSTIPTNSYSSSYTGTSMATPHVAGTIGLMYAAACPQFITDYKADPAGKSLLMFQYLMNGAVPVSSMNGLVVSNGRLNANNALINVQAYSPCLNSVSFTLPDALNKNEIQNIFPNPSNTNWVELEYTSTEDNFAVVVMNVYGQILKAQQRINHKGINKHKLDLGELPAGIYFIGIESANSKSNFVKVVKS